MTDVVVNVTGIAIASTFNAPSIRIVKTGARPLTKVVLPRSTSYEYDSDYLDRLVRQIQFHIDQTNLLINLIPGLSSADSDLQIRVAALEARVTALEP